MGLVPYSSHKVLELIIRTFIVLAGLQNQYNRVTACLLMHDALPSFATASHNLIEVITIIINKFLSYFEKLILE